ncbi:glycosyl hydrolase family 18 protein [Nocardioides dongkuii]|uniref:glycosyl hydrolase family 18 protein n=1 Tax=Nocardioides dongkuii TaxID=2760089 RepID=UPI0015FA89D1|nr:glycosyl hydrolase family 18 protein [Nocardioides dongkuii]
MRVRPLSVLLATAALLLAPVPAVAAPDLTGYALGSTPPAVVVRDAPRLSTLTVVGVSIRASGRGTTRPPRDTLRLGRVARAQGVRTELLVNNWSNRLEGFDQRAAARLLRDDDRVRRVAARVARLVAAGGWDGVNLDLERLRPPDGPGLVLLAAELQRRMPAEASVSVDVSARGTVEAYRAAGYRLGALARAVDVVQLMAYDQHGPTWSGPGPIGSLDWQRRSLRALLRAVPREQVDLGVAGYGYTWPSRGRVGRTVTVAGARALVRSRGGRPVWRAAVGEWRARLDDGTVVWWSDRRSLRRRERLATRQGLHGVALWRLGSADPL